VAIGVLTLAGEQADAGTMAGNVAWRDDRHFTFRAVGASSNDTGIRSSR
jgi:hypothetical protein